MSEAEFNRTELDDDLFDKNTKEKVANSKIFAKAFETKVKEEYVQTTILVTKEQHKFYDKIATKTKKSFSEVVRDVLEIARLEFYEYDEK